MLVVMRPGASAAELEAARAALAAGGAAPRTLPGDERVALVAAEGSRADPAALGTLPGVARVVTDPVPVLASRGWRNAPTTIPLPGGVTIGDGRVVLMAGPCAVENERQVMVAAHRVAEAGAHLLRGGAYKPRTSPYAFQGLGPDGLALLARAGRETGLPVVTEALDESLVDAVAEVAAVVQIGSRNMGNYPLLRRAARAGRPVLLKRGMAATLDELLLAAEYVLAEGNGQVILCERGIRGFDGATRNVLDLAAIPLLRRQTHLPVIADPSHGTGRRDLVPAMGLAAVAAGADGLLVEVHPDPETALSDGAQSLTPAGFAALVGELRVVAEAVGRPLAASPLQATAR
jgi:3-deoxy-7-phosphoheptulonate synthase